MQILAQSALRRRMSPPGSQPARWPISGRLGIGVDLTQIAFAFALGRPVPDALVEARFERLIAIRFLTASPGILPIGRLSQSRGSKTFAPPRMSSKPAYTSRSARRSNPFKLMPTEGAT